MKSKKITINISLLRNNQEKKVEFQGYGFVDSGYLSGGFLDKLSNWFSSEKALISAFTFTGCPIIARSHEVNLNPWVSTGGEYDSIRTLVGENFEVISKLSSRSIGDEITMSLDLEVIGVLPEICKVSESFQESISQIEIGKLRGEFSIVYEDVYGKRIPTTSKTEYVLPINFDVDDVWRNITIEIYNDSNTFRQIEQIDLFSNFTKAQVDLVEKNQVMK
jgi:hypothetical protein